jgi:hypothetical protein
LSCGIDVRQAITGKKGIVIILFHIVIFFISIALGDYGVYRQFQPLDLKQSKKQLYPPNMRIICVYNIVVL